MKKLLSGNEAIALGAYHAGLRVATAYPGTPSTEILETLATFPPEDVYVEWAPNEKVAVEVAMGAAYGGVRAMASMKHVGLNVAADPFFATSVTGIHGGLVVVTADDPYMHSSQNEQDNRNYAKFARVPMLEPADSQEAYDLMAVAFQLSEEHDTPVLVRTTTRISHCKSVVEAPESVQRPAARPRYLRDPQKYVTVPQYARPKHPRMEERIAWFSRFAETFPRNRMMLRDRRLGIISAGVAYQYAREVFPRASFLKLALTWPLPKDLIQRFASEVETLLVVEELDPFMEEAVRGLGLRVRGKDIFPVVGEFSTELVEECAGNAGLIAARPAARPPKRAPALPPRPPVLCPGCPHMATFFALKRLGFYRGLPDPDAPLEERALSQLRHQGLIVTSDIGCYTLAVYPPLLAVDTCACMGASIGQAMGMEKAGVANKTVAVLGDSTFMHSGITGLLDIVYNGGNVTVIILDNGTTAMTGHQGHPGTGVDARGRKTHRTTPEDIARGLGVRDVTVVDAYDVAAVEQTVARCVETLEPSVIVVRGPCPLHERVSGEALHVLAEECDGCGTCLRLGCPALGREGDKAQIVAETCLGDACGVCVQVCPREAIRPLARAEAGVEA